MKSSQPLDLLSELLEMPLADSCHLSARTSPAFAHLENGCDFFQGKAERFGLANKAEPVQVAGTIDAVPGFPPWRLRQQPLAFVKAHRLDVDGSLLGQFSNLHILTLNPIQMYRVKPCLELLRTAKALI